MQAKLLKDILGVNAGTVCNCSVSEDVTQIYLYHEGFSYKVPFGDVEVMDKRFCELYVARQKALWDCTEYMLNDFVQICNEIYICFSSDGTFEQIWCELKDGNIRILHDGSIVKRLIELAHRHSCNVYKETQPSLKVYNKLTNEQKQALKKKI